MSQSHSKNTQKGSGSARTSLVATAPYNFIPYDPEKTVSSPPDDGKAYAGVIRCRLRALTPLLVAGPQEKKQEEKGAQDRRFFMVDGKPVIPGTSLKGMLRSLVEIISHSHLSPVNGDKLFWRNVTGNKSAAYKEMFPADDAILGGFLHRRGSRCTLEPASRITRGTGPEAYETGWMPKKTKGYIFHRGKGEARDVPPDVVETFHDQMTDDQKKRWGKAEAPHLDNGKGARVFYIERAGKIAALGTARYFRVAYRHTVRDLAGECPPDDFAAALFGSVGQVIRKGRVAVGAARFSTWKELEPVTGILMTPHPTCLLHYLEQPNARDCGNKLDDLVTYGMPAARLRGRKYYWHCKSVRRCPDHLKSKSNILSRLHPLAAGAEAQFEIRVDGVSGVELGALLTALELPQGHAHKLGLGKAVGLGSVRLEVEDVLVQPRRERYASLRGRLVGGPAPLTAAARKELKAAFQDYVSACMGQPYEQLEAVRTLLVMTDFDHCPPPPKTAPMPLKEEKDGRPGFASKARLPSALAVWNGR